MSHTHWCINIKTQRKFPSNKQSLKIFSTFISSQTCPFCTKHTITGPVWTERGHTNIDHQRHIYWIFHWIFQCHWFQVKILWLEPHWKVIFTIQLFTALQYFSEHGVFILQNIFAGLTFCNFTSFSRKGRNKQNIPRAIWSPGIKKRSALNFLRTRFFFSFLISFEYQVLKWANIFNGHLGLWS